MQNNEVDSADEENVRDMIYYKRAFLQTVLSIITNGLTSLITDCGKLVNNNGQRSPVKKGYIICMLRDVLPNLFQVKCSILFWPLPLQGQISSQALPNHSLHPCLVMMLRRRKSLSWSFQKSSVESLIVLFSTVCGRNLFSLLWGSVYTPCILKKKKTRAQWKAARKSAFLEGMKTRDVIW